ncbi:NACHT domain-containing protein [Burkholderia sp. BKH01]|uniref:NACHT domain-containing protein n=1 Tax=Burkholderia sp. BKH01 TaxID=2769262 RepID=UPI0021E05DDB|nr:NACHT domain-containing protein [Burkholderia sp. BKH01]MCU9952597.1 NACHT domain-containing protein [Burkholderia sp. BKH01]
MAPHETDPSLDIQLNTPADRVPDCPPINTRIQVLPFGQLTWENFERLCYRLAGKAEHVEYVARYGRAGQAQGGIDLFVRRSSAKYQVWQAKRYDAITATDIVTMVEKFRAGSWREKSEQLILAVQASLADTKIQDAIEAQATLLRADGISLLPYGGEELSELLRGSPEIVDDFFGRQWVEAFLGLDAVKALGQRLDGGEFVRVRDQLRSYYNAHFHLLDVGVALPLHASGAESNDPPSLLKRFTVPDVVVRDMFAGETYDGSVAEVQQTSDSQRTLLDNEFVQPHIPRLSRRDYIRRSPLGSWIADGQHLAVVGDSGSGKSMLLRCIVLDLLSDKQTFPQIVHRWSGLLPLHISFSKWSRLSAGCGRPIGLKEAIAETLQPALTADLLSLMNRAIEERRCLLLIDGLDEWSDEQAARTTLQHVQAFVATHSLPAIVTARPRGLDRIGAIPSNWRVAELAPLSLEQQRELARVWFVKGFPTALSTGGQSTGEGTPVEMRLDRFFAELTRDNRLSTLASNPLLLVGLVALSIRQVALPRNRIQVLKSLVEILLDKHPNERATAAGDTAGRYVYLPDRDDRRAALARLAFVSRSESGGGTYDIKKAKKVIREYLIDPDHFAFAAEKAQNAAGELLAVNAETIGLLTERAPGEIGFAHAAFEEYLAAEHIQTWNLQDMLDFVRAGSGNTLWRNVISNLTCLLVRPAEVESVVSTIEDARAETGNIEDVISRDVLLADIAFNSARKPPATASRLIGNALDIIQVGDWMPARREALKSALASVSEGSSPIDDRIESWLPRRSRSLRNLFVMLGDWSPAPDLKEVLLRALHDEEISTQRAAARALANVYRGDNDVGEILCKKIQSTLDLSVAAAALEALTHGWLDTPEISKLHDAAFESDFPILKFTGISGRLVSGRTDQRDCHCLLGLLKEFPDLDIWERQAAQEMLIKNWPNDPAVEEAAFNSLSGHRSESAKFDRGVAIHYLLGCSPTNKMVADWVRSELKADHPFLLSRDDMVWDRVADFAIEHDDIRNKVMEFIKKDYGRYNLHFMQELVIKLRGNEIRDELINISRAESDHMLYWAIAPLVKGWGWADPVVAALMAEIVEWEDDRIQHVATLLPEIFRDSVECKAKLLTLANSSKVKRLDLIARGLAVLGCDGADADVVDILLASVGRTAPAYDPGEDILTYYHSSVRVKEYALQALTKQAPPIAILAKSYKDDEAIRAKVLAFANPLPAPLRGDIIEVASTDANGRSALERILAGYDIEADGELKITSSICFHRHISSYSEETHEDHLTVLRRDLRAVGPDLEERRAAAFAGMLILGHVDDVVPMMDYGDKPLDIPSGKFYGEESESLAALLSERWSEVRQAFGDTFATRFGRIQGDERYLWECLAPHISESPVARRDFLAFCGSTQGVIGVRSMMALAREDPSSRLLYEHCCRVLSSNLREAEVRYSPWNILQLRLETAYIVRENFPGDLTLIEQVREAFVRGHLYALVAFPLIAPNDHLVVNLPYGPRDVWERTGQWISTVHVAATCSNAHEFVEIALAMINRKSHHIWDFQSIINRAVIERLQRDDAVGHHFKSILADCPTESETASLPRYLLAVGQFDTEVLLRCRSLLGEERRRILPRAGYDAIEGATRAISRSLLEVLAPSLST